jgi:hypothetical protein
MPVPGVNGGPAVQPVRRHEVQPLENELSNPITDGRALPGVTRLVPTALACAWMLVACGGSGGDNPPPPPPPPGAALTLSGTAATGAAIAARSVEARCNGGTGSANTGADGRYSIALSAGALPCVLRVTTSGGTTLHSLAAGSGATAVSNLTPVSELVMARLAAGSPAAYYTAFDAAAATALTSARVDAALSAVQNMLTEVGVTLPAGANLLTGNLVAANGANAGNGLDQALDALNARLVASNVALTTLAEILARSAPDAPPAVLSGTPSLPAAQLLQPAAANCNALRSGRYRYVIATPSSTPDTGVLQFDATTLTFSVEGEAGSGGTLTANGNCRYTIVDGSFAAEFVVSQAGVMVFRDTVDGVYRLGVLFPEQTHPVAALAGEWNALGFEPDGGSNLVASATVTIDANGAITNGEACPGTRVCFPVESTLRFSANASGGYDFRDTTDTWVDRTFMYRTGGGEPMLAFVSVEGSLTLATRKRTNVLPALGLVSNMWNLTVDNLGRANAPVSDGSNTITSVNAEAGSYTRNSVFNPMTGATVPESLFINNPRAGFNHRVAASGVQASDGSTRNVSEFTALGLRGTGLAPVALPASNGFVISVTK